MAWKSFVFGFFVAMFLIFTPPSSNIIGHHVRAWHPIASIVHVHTTLNGAHAALIAKAAMELGVFDLLATASNATGIDSMSRWTPSSLLIRLVSGYGAHCFGVRDISDSTTITDDIGVHELMNALAAVDLVATCPSGIAWRLTLGAALFIAGDKSVGRMATVSNDAAILLPMTQLARKLTSSKTKGDNQSQHSWQESLGNLWVKYALHSEGFSESVAQRVAASVTVDEPFTLLDIGAGSGIYTKCILGRAINSRAVVVDFPEVVNALVQRWPSELNSRTEFVGGSVFDDAALKTIDMRLKGASRVVIMMNSFLQHFSDAHCLELLRRLGMIASANHSRIATFVITELVTPEGAFNPLVELLPVSRSFGLSIRAFTEDGRVRTAQEYREMLSKDLCGGASVNREGVQEQSLFPMPAMVFKVC